jgi:hypothetical protein
MLFHKNENGKFLENSKFYLFGPGDVVKLAVIVSAIVGSNIAG